MLPRLGGGVCDGTGPVAGDKAVPITWGKDGLKGPSKAPAPHRLVRANHLKHFLDASWRLEPGAGFLPMKGPIPPPHSALSRAPGTPGCFQGDWGVTFLPPEPSLPMIHGTAGRVWAREVDGHSCPSPLPGRVPECQVLHVSMGDRDLGPSANTEAPLSNPAPSKERRQGWRESHRGWGAPVPLLSPFRPALLQSWRLPPSCCPSSPSLGSCLRAPGAAWPAG